MAKFILALSLFSIPVTLSMPVFQKITDEECMALALHHEARGEPLTGQRAIIDVIQNRARKFGKSVCNVVMQRRQFSFYDYNATYIVTNEMLTRLNVALTMSPIVTEGVFWYHTSRVKPIWRLGLQKVKKVGGHIFYTHKEK